MRIYQLQLGAREFLVAAENRLAALAAIAIDLDLFEDGKASETHDDELASLALAVPGRVLERPVWARRKVFTPALPHRSDLALSAA